MGITTARSDDRLLSKALVFSLCLHLAIAAFFPMPSRIQSEGATVETISFARIIHISSEPARAAARTRLAAAPERAPHPTVTHPQPAPSSRTARPVHAAPSTERAAAPMVAAARAGGTAEAPGASAPPASAPPVQTQSTSVASRSETGGYMPLGADLPVPVLDPAVAKSLDALGAHVTIVVTVDADGHTKRIDFQTRLDAAIEARIRSLLASASWDPAVCGGGVPCEGTTTLKL